MEIFLDPSAAGDVEFDHSVLSNKNVVCEHGNLDPEAHKKYKLISKEAGEMFLNGGYTFSPMLKNTDLCTICSKEAHSALCFETKHKISLDSVKRLLKKRSDGLAYWISKKWMSDWKRKNPTCAKDRDILSPSSENYKSDVFCPHNNLQFDEKTRMLIPKQVHDILVTVVPSSTEWLDENAEECAICETERKTLIDSNQDFLEAVAYQKGSLRRVLGGRNVPVHLDDTFFIIPRGLLVELRAFYKDPLGHTRPEVISCRQFLCRHAKFCASGDCDFKKSIDWFLVTQEEWKVLSEGFRVETPISVVFSEDKVVSSFPEMCVDCYDETLLDFVQTAVTIQEVCKGDNKEAVPVVGTKRRKAGKRRPAPFSVDVCKSDTVLDIKRMICERNGVLPLLMELYIDGKLLDCNDDTVFQLKIKPNQLIEFMVIEQGEFADDEVGSVEVGFVGTNLVG